MKSHPLENAAISAGEKDLQAVGQWLKETRERKGESLDNVANITRIGKNYLEALEEGAVAKLPNQAYTRGFIRLYASHLGLSPDEVLRMLSGQTADSLHHDRQEPPPAPSDKLPGNRQTIGAKKIIKLIFLLIGAVALTIIVMQLASRNSQKKSAVESQPVSTVPPPSGATPAVPPPPPPLSTTAPPPAAADPQQNRGEITSEDGIVLRLKAVSAGRLHITIDGSASQEYDLVAGDLVEWKAEKMFLLDLENACSVEGELDGKPLRPFGEAGKAAHLIIRQNGVQQD